MSKSSLYEDQRNPGKFKSFLCKGPMSDFMFKKTTIYLFTPSGSHQKGWCTNETPELEGSDRTCRSGYLLTFLPGWSKTYV